MDGTEKLFTALLVSIVGVAILSVILSKNSQTSGVINAAGSAFGGLLKIAESPITGGSGGGAGTGGLTGPTIATPAGGVNIPGLVTSATGLIGGVNTLIGTSNSGGLTGVPGGPGIYAN